MSFKPFKCPLEGSVVCHRSIPMDLMFFTQTFYVCVIAVASRSRPAFHFHRTPLYDVHYFHLLFSFIVESTVFLSYYYPNLPWSLKTIVKAKKSRTSKNITITLVFPLLYIQHEYITKITMHFSYHKNTPTNLFRHIP